MAERRISTNRDTDGYADQRLRPPAGTGSGGVDLEITIKGGPVPDDVSYGGRYIPFNFKDQDDEHDEAPHNVRWHP